jgi:hypothetical protein
MPAITATAIGSNAFRVIVSSGGAGTVADHAQAQHPGAPLPIDPSDSVALDLDF